MRWKVAAVGFAVTTLVLGLIVVLRAAPTTVATVQRPTGTTSPEPVSVPRQRVARPARTAEAEAAAVDTPTDNAAEVRDALAAIDVREVLYRHALEGTTGAVKGVTFELLMERLRADEAAALLVLDDWIGRYAALDVQDVNADPRLFSVYAELRGEAAIPALRALADRWGVLPALIRAGSRDEIERIDADIRDAGAESFIDPQYVARGGPLGLEYVRRWANAASILAERRRAARKALWVYGTPEDRDALWERATALERLDDLGGWRPQWPGNWQERIRGACLHYLDDPDPWARMRAAQSILSRSATWRGEIRDAAIERARLDTQLANPGGHDQGKWDAVQIQLRSEVQAADRDAKRRALLGLD